MESGHAGHFYFCLQSTISIYKFQSTTTSIDISPPRYSFIVCAYCGTFEIMYNNPQLVCGIVYVAALKYTTCICKILPTLYNFFDNFFKVKVWKTALFGFTIRYNLLHTL